MKHYFLSLLLSMITLLTIAQNPVTPNASPEVKALLR